MRYNQLLPLIAFHKPKTIVEVGTWNGLRAIMMATEALKHQKRIHYIGFDLFEDATPDTDARELNVKAHSSLADVEGRLAAFQDSNKGFRFTLIKGDTLETLPETITLGGNLRKPRKPVDFAFIDGGHSLKTIANDFEHLKKAKVVVLDDFYTGRDTSKHGCNTVLKGENHLVLPHKDPVKDGGKVQMVVLPAEAWPGPKNIIIKTKNCVPDEEIQTNVQYAKTRIENWIVECKPHHETAVMVSGGPSFKDYMDEISTQSRIVCVKHAHDILIENGVIPWACMLLDPRSHVQDFIENPHPEVTYFVASMCHPTTVDKLLKEKANVWGYHAHVGAGEEKFIGKGIMVGGGSTSAVRGVSVLHTLGFRDFKMYGYDSCYGEKMDKGVKDKLGRQKYFKVEVSGKRFWTDAELLAQAQDFTKLMDQPGDLQLDVIGEGMIPHVWSLKRRILPDFRDVLSG